MERLVLLWYNIFGASYLKFLHDTSSSMTTNCVSNTNAFHIILLSSTLFCLFIFLPFFRSHSGHIWSFNQKSFANYMFLLYLQTSFHIYTMSFLSLNDSPQHCSSGTPVAFHVWRCIVVPGREPTETSSIFILSHLAKVDSMWLFGDELMIWVAHLCSGSQHCRHTEEKNDTQPCNDYGCCRPYCDPL